MTLVLNGTTGISAVDGSASTPAIQGNDSNTGVFFPSADTVAIATGGTERVRTDSSGNVGIGTSSPAVKLQVKSSAEAFRIEGTAARGSGNIFSSFHDPSGRKGYWGYGASDDNLYIANEMNAAMLFITNASERARIDSSGNLLVGTTSISLGRVNISGYTNGDRFGLAMRPSANNATPILFQNAAGTDIGTIATTSTATAYNTSSDYRLKQDIAPMTGALARVARLKPCTYKWKADGSEGEGFIAHELAEVVPGCVTGEKDAVNADGSIKAQGIDTSFLVATLTAAIQEQQALITSLTARIAALEGAAS